MLEAADAAEAMPQAELIEQWNRGYQYEQDELRFVRGRLTAGDGVTAGQAEFIEPMASAGVAAGVTSRVAAMLMASGMKISAGAMASCTFWA